MVQPCSNPKVRSIYEAEGAVKDCIVWPRQPWYLRFHGFWYHLCTEVPGKVARKVRIIREHYDPQCPEKYLDLWLQEDRDLAACSRPIVFFIHGGGWNGKARQSHLGPLLHLLAANDWFVVNCEYRKKWPLHVQDC